MSHDVPCPLSSVSKIKKRSQTFAHSTKTQRYNKPTKVYQICLGKPRFKLLSGGSSLLCCASSFGLTAGVCKGVASGVSILSTLPLISLMEVIWFNTERKLVNELDVEVGNELKTGDCGGNDGEFGLDRLKRSWL